MYYNYDIRSSGVMRQVEGVGIWMIISAVIAVMGGIVIYFMFLTKDNEKKLTGKAKLLYDFLSFKNLLAEVLLRVIYLIVAIYITLSSFALISTSFIAFLLYLIVGNIVVRLLFEFALIILLICKNITEINSKMPQKDSSKAKPLKKEDK